MNRAITLAPPAGVKSEDKLRTDTYLRIAKLVEERSGIRLPPAKRSITETRLRKRMLVVGLHSFADYCTFLYDDANNGEEVDQLIYTLTTHKTDFFREAVHFGFLQQHALPSLLAARCNEVNKPTIKVWSAACSRGAEAYTLAMVLHEQMELRGNFRFVILGTDISEPIVEEARRAVYPAAMMTPVPTIMRKRYVMQPREPNAQNEVRISASIRKYVRFDCLNLMDERYPFDCDVDIIYLRNVLIYFSPQDQQAVVTRLYNHLRPGGFLFLGHSEGKVGSDLGLTQIVPSVFQRT